MIDVQDIIIDSCTGAESIRITRRVPPDPFSCQLAEHPEKESPLFSN